MSLSEFLKNVALTRMKLPSSPSTPGIIPGSPVTLSVAEGDALTVKGAAASTGTVQRVTSSGANLGSAIAITSASQTLPAVAGTSYYKIACTAGSIDASVGDAVLLLKSSRKIASASVRASIATQASTVMSGSNVLVHRTYDKTNVVCDTPWLVMANKYIDGGGAQRGSAVEIGTGGSIQVRAAFLTGIAAATTNQSTATVWKCTFFGMKKDGAFLAAGGSVSTDGLTITVPDGYMFRTDPQPGLRLTAGQKYIQQVEITYQVGFKRIAGRSGRTDLGDMRFVTNSGSANTVYNKDFSAGTLIGGAQFYPAAVLGYGNAKVVAIDGDSIFSDGAGTVGDADGVTSIPKQALNAAGYSFIDVSIPGSNVNDLTYGGYDLRMGLLAEVNPDVVWTDGGHNDRGAAQLTQTWAAVLPLMQWHTGLLRSSAPNARIIRSTLCPHTNSSNSFVDSAGQTYQTAADTYPTGWQFSYSDWLLRKGAYAGIAFSGLQEPDAAFDLAGAVLMTADGKWASNGMANYYTPDGTHPVVFASGNVATVAAQLPSLLGF